jgi:hypothetical protein
MDIPTLLNIRTKVVSDLLVCSQPGPIQGVCAGPDDPCDGDDNWKIQIYTRRPLGEREHNELVGILDTYEVPYNILYRGKLSFLSGPVIRPAATGEVAPGNSIFADGNSGTLGLIVTKDGNDRYLFTCSHILGDAKDVCGLVGGNRQKIATVTCSTDFQTPRIVADAGIAKLVNGVPFSTTFPRQLGNVRSDVVTPAPGMKIAQFGAQTQQKTKACVVHSPCDFCLEEPGGGFFHFANVAVTDSADFAQHGDSGSIAVTDEASPSLVGIVFSFFSDQGGPLLIGSLQPALNNFAVKPVV